MRALVLVTLTTLQIGPSHGQMNLPLAFAAGLQSLQSQVAGLNLGFFGQTTRPAQRVAAAVTDAGNIGVISIPPIQFLLSSSSEEAVVASPAVVPSRVQGLLSTTDTVLSISDLATRSTITLRTTLRETGVVARSTSSIAAAFSSLTPVTSFAAGAAATPTSTARSIPSAVASQASSQPDGADLAGTATKTKPAGMSRAVMIVLGSLGAVAALVTLVGAFFVIRRYRRARFEETMFCRGDGLEKTLPASDKTYGGLSRKRSKDGKVLKIERLWQRRSSEGLPSDGPSFNLLNWRHISGAQAAANQIETPISTPVPRRKPVPPLPHTLDGGDEERDEVADILHRYTDPAQYRGFSSLYSTDVELPIGLGSPVRAKSPWFQWQREEQSESVSFGQQRTGMGNVILNDEADARAMSIRPIAELSKFSLSEYSNDYRQTTFPARLTAPLSFGFGRSSKQQKPRNTTTNYSVRSGLAPRPDQTVAAADSSISPAGWLMRSVKKVWRRE